MTKSNDLSAWHTVQDNNDRRVSRMRVPEGAIYLITEWGEFPRISIINQMAVFAPSAGDKPPRRARARLATVTIPDDIGSGS